MTSSPDHAADPQLPMLGPMTTPSIASSQWGGSDGPAPGMQGAGLAVQEHHAGHDRRLELLDALHQL